MKSPTPLRTLAVFVALAISNSTQNSFAAELDAGFGAQVNGTVHAIEFDAAGNILVGGEFAEVNGSPRQNLAKLRSSGEVDGSFGAETDGAILALGADGSGAVYVGGAFNAPARHLAKIGANGEVLPLGIGSSTSSRIDCMAVAGNGAVVVGGAFRGLDGAAAVNVARVTSAGTIDVSFQSGLLASMALEAGADAIAVQADGKVIVGGFLNTTGGVTALVRLNGDGTLDSSFAGGQGPILYTRTIVVSAGGKILVAGVASSAGDGFVRRLNMDGSVDTSFREARFNGSVEAIAVLRDGGVIAAGRFSGGLARLNLDGTVDTAWSIQANGVVKALAVRENDLVIGGAFSKVGNAMHNGIARIKLANKDVFATSSNGRFVARIQGETGKTYDIQASSNLKAWNSIGTATATDGGIDIADASAGLRDYRFFRARLIE